MPLLNIISFLGIFGLCFIAWLFSENRSPRVFPWRVAIAGILLQLALGACVFILPGTRDALQVFSNLLNSVFDAADTGARFVFGRNIVPVPGTPPDVNLGYIFAFRALPTVIFFSGLMALLYNIGVIQVITNVFAKVFYATMRLSGAEALSGAANIFVGIEAAIVVKPFLPKMTRSELCAILACCFGTAASSTLAIYVSFLKPVFPNILGHLVSASIMAIPACFVLSKILVPETEVPVTAGGIPVEEKQTKVRDTVKEPGEVAADAGDFPRTRIQVDDDDDVPVVPQETVQETVGGEPIERVSPLDAAIVGALDGVKMAVAIAAVLILILGFVSLINQVFAWLATLPFPIGNTGSPSGVAPGFFGLVTLQNILGALFLPLTALTGVSLNWEELWQSSIIIGRRLFETAIPPYQELAAAAALPVGERVISDRAVLIISYALSGFAHLASVGIFVGGTIALIPSRRKDISELGWKALFIGTLATLMIACVAGVFDTGNASILGERQPLTVSPSPTPTASTSPIASPTITPPPTPIAVPARPSPRATQTVPQPSPRATVRTTPQLRATPAQPSVSPKPTTSVRPGQ
ncbi:MAG: nucleoside:proton symporter [Tildeniella nuda ZEHNDER 1965/U140]|jgi:CNT family concentrative nucleoside transporter|nr:nucleoside:proton symporter [Tildeniella nuda ZEHNDER 1965/U140]